MTPSHSIICLTFSKQYHSKVFPLSESGLPRVEPKNIGRAAPWVAQAALWVATPCLYYHFVGLKEGQSEASSVDASQRLA